LQYTVTICTSILAFLLILSLFSILSFSLDDVAARHYRRLLLAGLHGRWNQSQIGKYVNVICDACFLTLTFWLCWFQQYTSEMFRIRFEPR